MKLTQLNVFHLAEKNEDIKALKDAFKDLQNDNVKISVRSFRKTKALINALIKDHFPSFIVLGLQFPGGENGLDLCRELKQSYSSMTVYIDASGLSTKAKTEAYKAGADVVIEKETRLPHARAKHLLNVFLENSSRKQGGTQKSLVSSINGTRIVGGQTRKIISIMSSILEQRYSMSRPTELTALSSHATTAPVFICRC